MRSADGDTELASSSGCPSAMLRPITKTARDSSVRARLLRISKCWYRRRGGGSEDRSSIGIEGPMAVQRPGQGVARLILSLLYHAALVAWTGCSVDAGRHEPFWPSNPKVDLLVGLLIFSC